MTPVKAQVENHCLGGGDYAQSALKEMADGGHLKIGISYQLHMVLLLFFRSL